MLMSRSGSIDSRVSSCAITSLADASSICTPRKMIRSSKSLLYGFISLTPYVVRSTKDGMMYRLSTGRGKPSWICGRIKSLMRSCLRSVLASRDGALGGHLVGAQDHLVDEAVVPGSVRGEPPVAIGVLLDLLEGLTG